MARERYELRLERLDGGRLPNRVEEVTEFFDLDDAYDTETTLAKHFLPLACAAEGEDPGGDRTEMPWLARYVLRIYTPGSTRLVTSYRGWLV
ncbi:hypothetical protein [Amycolatopsis decaplanina]|uniref:Uncharacterized protein n=1 Tax=Amycolatopsis decaplanina DSM 44594 TaxID=1284240 RepID=M2Z3U6_9PSEU|nr:hypothetical protein [Amycolatopsis decaplanina]EME61927.1 hypothetical protein H074_09585 [Amycolatopsis decaplanina DSM 44594]